MASRGERSAAGAKAFDPVAIVMGVGFAFMWSSAFTSAKIALIDAPPLLLLTVRFLFAGTVALGIALALGQRLPGLPRQWALIAFLGVCQNALYLGLNFVAMTEVPAGLAAIIASTMPLLVAAAGPLLKERLGGLAVLGLGLGFAGTLVIVADRLGGDLPLWGFALCLIAVGALAAATLTVRHGNLGGGLMTVVGLQMLVGGVVLAPFALLFESFAAVRPTPTLGLAFLYITFVPGILATLVWFNLIRRIGAARASAYHFLNPAFGVAVAWAVLGESFDLIDALGVAVVALGILLVQRDRA